MLDEASKNAIRISERLGKYEILGHIASGGMGMVYLARDVDLDRQVALKILPRDLAKQAVTLVRFQREAKAAARLRHENIVAIYDVGETDGHYFIALEYVDGTDLQAYITRKCRLDPEEARNIMMQAARALVHAHEQGIVHRDIKPSNFLLMLHEKRVTVKLTDFGLAIRNESDDEFRITKDRTTVGTVDYMSPEQARDSRSADIRSDIYSLGCTFYHMLGGAAPFARGTMPERLLQHMNDAPLDVRKLNRAVPRYLVYIIKKMLAKKPEERYQSPAELLHHLEHPEKVPMPPKKTATSKGVRGTSVGRPSGTTAVIENEVIDRDSAEPEQVKPSKRKRDTDAPAKLEEEPADDRDTYAETDHTKFGTDVPDDEEENFGVDDEEAADDDEEDDEEEDEKNPLKKIPKPVLLIGAIAGSAVLLGLVIVIAIAVSRPSPQRKKETEKKPDQPPVVRNVEKDPEEVPPVLTDTTPTKMTVREWPFPKIDGETPADLAALRQEYVGPFGAFPEPLKSASVATVRRLTSTGPTSLLAALSAAANPTMIIEFADNGPIFVSALPAQKDRTIVLRGAPGYRPTLVWDLFKMSGDPKTGATWLSLTKGTLILEDLDIAVKCFDEPAVALFDLPDTDFHARNCTFSLAGKSASGIVVVRRTAGDKRTQTRFQRCYVRGGDPVRGGDATVLSTSAGAADLLLEESLIVGYRQPLIHFRAKDAESPLGLYCVRSTLTTGQVLLRWQGSLPQVQGRVLDSILSRDDPSLPQGDLLQVDSALLSKMSWKASNSVYAGWKQLLATGTMNIAGHDLEAWRRQWKTSEGERIVLEPWPNSPPPALDDHPADTFLTAHTPVGFAALTGAGAIGSVIGWLPATPAEGWQDRAFKQRDFPILLNVQPEVPRIDVVNDGMYHGEKLDLSKVDLGAHLNAMLEKMSPAPRVVLHLTGKGVREINPVRVKGVPNLILYFEKDAKDPLTLEAAPTGFKQRAPMIEVVDGNLEVIGARMKLSNLTFVPTMIQVQGGSLTLTNCWLQGPLIRSPEAFKQLIVATNHTGTPATLLLRNNVFLSGKALIQMNEQVQLRARNNLFVGLGDGLHIDCAGPSPALTHVLEQNTWAIRQTFMTLRTPAEALAGGPVLAHAAKNVFLHPFADEQDKGTLLRGAELAVANGLWTWQAKLNVYDPRLHAYFAALPSKTAGPRQTLKDWQRAWGPIAEQDAQTLDGAAATRTLALDNAAPPAVLLQLERLAVPNQGADFVTLGILKKKS